jgi:hypothetical protein
MTLPAPEIFADDIDVSLDVVKLRLAPLLMTTLPWIEEAIAERVPLVILVLAIVFVPVKVNAPVLTSVPAPDIPPEKLPPPIVKLFVLEMAIDPAPLTDPIVVLAMALSVPATL